MTRLKYWSFHQSGATRPMGSCPDDGVGEVGGHAGVVMVEVGRRRRVLAVVGDVGVRAFGVGEGGRGRNQSKELERCSDTPAEAEAALAGRAECAQRPTTSFVRAGGYGVSQRGWYLESPEIVAVSWCTPMEKKYLAPAR